VKVNVRARAPGHTLNATLVVTLCAPVISLR
jgi:hypothetical protein